MASMRNFLVLFMMLLNLLSSFSATDMVTQTQFISDSKNETILSSNGNFKLGFFSPGKSAGRYVGIWFNKVPKQTVVWVANRQIPLNNSTGIFKIDKDGNLAVFNGNETTPLWSTNISMPITANISSATARLLPSGNLVLVVKNDSAANGETIIWQSFDHPTDTVLPGMKFGLNRKSSISLVLTSWKSSDDPAVGDFSYSFDPQGSPQLFLYKNMNPSWRCGPWNGHTMSGLPYINDPAIIDIFNYTYENNPNEFSVSFSSSNESTPSIFVLEPLGSIQQLVWRDAWTIFWKAPEDICDEYARCGASTVCNPENTVECTCLPGFERLSPHHDWHIDCVEKRKVINRCGKGDGEGFVRVESVKLPDVRFSKVYGNLNLKECESECLKGCNCTGYASADVDVTESGSKRCIAWFGELADMRKFKAGQDFYLRVDATDIAAYARENSGSSRARKNRMLFLIIVPTVLGVLLLGSCYFYWWRRHAKKKGEKMKQRRQRELLFLDQAASDNDESSNSNSNSKNESRSVDVTFFKLSTVVVATNNFSSSNKLGQGGYGPVYKGQLSNGQEIAIKRLSKSSVQGVVEFKNEVLLIAKLQHRNLVKLLGCCIEEDEKMLIYEFMPNKSLDYFIFDESRKLLLDWKKRFNIILGIARGILYLHQDSRLRIIHRDLKASNILLDAEMNPKISDFGTARMFEGEQTQANTDRVVGTFGYMSPEYVLQGHFSVKSDVYSFGVLLLEIISGKKNSGLLYDDESSSLIRYAWKLWRDEKALEIVDSCLVPAEALRCIQVGLLCVQDSASDRPSMSTVVFMLSNETSLPYPKEPTFAVRRVQYERDSTSSGIGSSFVYDETETTLSGR